MLLCVTLAHGEPPARLYGTSIRMRFEDGAARMECNLYRIEPSTGKPRILAAVQMDGTAVAIVSLAIHPLTEVIFGVSAAASPAAPQSLVVVDPVTGATTRVAGLAQSVSDIGFTNDGTLYGWLPDAARLARIDAATAAISLLEPSGIGGAIGGSMAIDDDDQGFVAATGATGTLDRVDLKTGRVTRGPALHGAPFPGAVTNLTFSPENKLFAVNSDFGSPAAATLVRIDARSGMVEAVGRLPDDSRALIFVPQALAKSAGMDVQKWVGLALVVALVLGVAAVAIARLRRRSG